MPRHTHTPRPLYDPPPPGASGTDHLHDALGRHGDWWWCPGCGAVALLRGPAARRFRWQARDGHAERRKADAAAWNQRMQAAGARAADRQED